MKHLFVVILGCLLLAGCTTSPPPEKQSPAKPRPNGEQQLRDSLAHTKPQPHRQ